MKFRPCIDIHNGKVKQIVGSSLADMGNVATATDNFVSSEDGGYYATLYKNAGLDGGHIIILNPEGSEWYEQDCKQASLALKAFNGGLQIGGGITDKNAKKFLDMGASHVIVTSFVFKDGKINFDRLNSLLKETTLGDRKRLVLDLSCRKKDGKYYIVTDRWQKFTEVEVNAETLDMLCNYCDEFLVHAVDVEGKVNGIEQDLVKLLGDWRKIPITYAGGVSCFDDLEKLKSLGKTEIDVTIGSALDLFGGNMEFTKVIDYIK